MALDLTGIQNVEFYSGHYLDAVLEGDLKAVFGRWASEEKEEGTRSPHKALGALAERYFRAKGQAEGERDAVERWRHGREFHAHLLEALGYPYHPSAEALEGDEVCPVLLALRRDGNPFLWVVDAPFVGEEDDDPMGAAPLSEQLPADAEGAQLPAMSWRALFDDHLFRLDNAPRWVLFLAGREAVLVERH